jgi:hypothetical protein
VKNIQRFRQILVCNCFLFLILTLPAFAGPQGGCKLPLTELQAGVYEADLGNVKVKTELYNSTVKLKLIGEVNEDWSSVTTEDSRVGLITGYLGNGDSAQVVAEIVIQQQEQGYDFAIFKADQNQINSSRITGVAYFYDHGQVKCVSTNYQKWVSGRGQIFGEDYNRSSINLQRDGFGA